jgi:ABC-type nitrate/sulfonate/bicarbonate transport system substrate-binding protein
MENQPNSSSFPNSLALQVIRIILLTGILGALSTSPHAAEQTTAGQVVTIAVVPGEISGLIYLAREKGFFQEQGIEVRLEEHEVDYKAVQALLDGKVQFATASEFVVVRKILMNRELIILSTICRANVYRIVSHGSGRIDAPGNLRGKRIGIRFASIAEFYLSRFLLFNGIASDKVQVVELPPRETAYSLISGDIDAALLMLDDITRLKETIPEQELLAIPAQQGIDLYWLLACTPEQADNPASAAILRALVAAERFLEQQRQEALALLLKTLNLQKLSSDAHTFRVALEQPLVLTMEDEARWLLKKQLDPDGSVPNFLQSIHFETLRTIKPEAVNIIH